MHPPIGDLEVNIGKGYVKTISPTGKIFRDFRCSRMQMGIQKAASARRFLVTVYLPQKKGKDRTDDRGRFIKRNHHISVQARNMLSTESETSKH
jgi:hypothetical protein